MKGCCEINKKRSEKHAYIFESENKVRLLSVFLGMCQLTTKSCNKKLKELFEERFSINNNSKIIHYKQYNEERGNSLRFVQQFQKL